MWYVGECFRACGRCPCYFFFLDSSILCLDSSILFSFSAMKPAGSGILRKYHYNNGSIAEFSTD